MRENNLLAHSLEKRLTKGIDKTPDCRGPNPPLAIKVLSLVLQSILWIEEEVEDGFIAEKAGGGRRKAAASNKVPSRGGSPEWNHSLSERDCRPPPTR